MFKPPQGHYHRRETQTRSLFSTEMSNHLQEQILYDRLKQLPMLQISRLCNTHIVKRKDSILCEINFVAGVIGTRLKKTSNSPRNTRSGFWMQSFSFSKIGCLTKACESSLLYYFPNSWSRNDRFMPFWRVLRLFGSVGANENIYFCRHSPRPNISISWYVIY